MLLCSPISRRNSSLLAPLSQALLLSSALRARVRLTTGERTGCANFFERARARRRKEEGEEEKEEGAAGGRGKGRCCVRRFERVPRHDLS